MPPVDVDSFLNDDTVTEIIYKSKIGTIITDVDFNIEDLCPQLKLNNEFILLKDATVTIKKSSSPQFAVITVTNAEIYDEITWYCKSSVPLTTTDGVSSDDTEFTANTANNLFKNAGLYMVTVIGLVTEDQKHYGITFNVKVES